MKIENGIESNIQPGGSFIQATSVIATPLTSPTSYAASSIRRFPATYKAEAMEVRFIPRKSDSEGCIDSTTSMM